MEAWTGQFGLFGVAGFVAVGVVVGVAANEAFVDLARILGLSGHLSLSDLAPAAVGVAIVFSTSLILAAWSYRIGRRAAEAARESVVSAAVTVWDWIDWGRDASRIINVRLQRRELRSQARDSNAQLAEIAEVLSRRLGKTLQQLTALLLCEAPSTNPLAPAGEGFL